MILLPEPQSPSRTLKGESIKSLRKLLNKSLSSSNLTLPELKPDSPQHSSAAKKEDDNNKNKEEASKPTPDTALQLQVASADEVRHRLLQNLGIQKQSDLPPNGYPSTQKSTTFEPWGPSTTEPLKGDYGNPNPTKLSSSCTLKEPRKLRFDSIVQSHPIPSFRVYSNRIQQTIWTKAGELGENVARNSLEFSYENWDANQVLDEDNGLIWYKGEWVHPVHFDIVHQQEDEEKETPPPAPAPAASSEEDHGDEIWKKTCERLGIQPAEYYHSLEGPSLQRQPSVVESKKAPAAPAASKVSSLTKSISLPTFF